MSTHNKHIAVIAFPFGSHPLPLLSLTTKLAHAAPNVAFSFINTATSNRSLFSKPNIPHNIVPCNVSDGVPEGHVLGAYPVEKIDFFLQAGLENLQKGIDLAEKNTNQKVTCIIADAFVTPSLTVAQNFSVPWIAAWPPLSTALSFHFYTHLIRHHIVEHDTKTSLDFLPGLSQMQFEDIPNDVVVKSGEKETLFSQALASMGEVLPQATAVVMSFYEELDPPLYVEDMRSKLKSLLYIGPFTLSYPFPPVPPSHTDTTGSLQFLDKYGDSKSAVYVSFGTVASPPPHELGEVADALEASGFPFLWSLKDDKKALLPNGFVERTGMRGKIVPWAPQTEVLGHEAIGVFVTHCGSNSMAESVANGVPMICRPFFGDHGIAGRMIEAVWGIGVKMEGGVFTKNGLLKSLNLILKEEDGKKIRENAFKLKKIVDNAAGLEGKAAQSFKTLVGIISSS